MIEIKGMKVSNVANRKRFIDNQGEWAEDLVATWGCDKYFSSIWCHVEGIDSLIPNTMYIFCQGHDIKTPYRQCDTINVTETLKEFVEYEEEPSLDLYSLRLFQKPEGYKIIQFTLEHKNIGPIVIGQYIVETNVLWVCDMSHTNQFKRFTKFWELLVKDYLKPFVIPTTIPEVKIILGADPEFEVIDNGCVIMCPTTVCKGNFNDMRLVEKIGTDGARTQLELRPKPGRTPEELVANIKELFENINHYHVSAKGQGYPVGGHIHFGLVQEVGLPTKLPVSTDFLKILDLFLGSLFISLSGSARGQFTQNGVNGGYRDQPHGFEYRPLPACIFSEPELCRIILKMAQNLATKYYNDKTIVIEGKKPTFMEYLTITGITEKEWNHVNKFVHDYEPEDYDENVVTNWVERYDNPLTIQFFDLWSADIKAKFRSEIKHIKVPRPLNVILYGISMKKWGIKYTGFPLSKYLKDGCHNMEHPPGCPHPKNGLAFGFPQGERTYADRNGHGSIGFDFCVEAVKNEINSINWDDFRDNRPITSVTLGVL